MYITGNGEEGEFSAVEDQKNARRVCTFFGKICWDVPDSWTPSGRITVDEVFQDSRVSGQPVSSRNGAVKGVKVRTRRYTKIRTTYTDRNGNYSFPNAFKRPVNYSLVFENRQVRVVDAVGLVKRYNGPKRRSSWNHHISNSAWNWLDATIVNAASDFEKSRRPSKLQTPFYDHRLLGIRSRQAKGRNHAANWAPVAGVPFIRPAAIVIFRYHSESGQPYRTDQLYFNVIHELGHQSHYQLMGNLMGVQQNLVRESWAEFISYYITSWNYPNYCRVDVNPLSKCLDDAIPNRSAEVIRRDWSSQYTQVFIDLIDTDNQLTILKGNRADDRVTGYNVEQIQTAISKATNRLNKRTIVEIKEYLRNNYDNPTEAELNRLFRFYEQF